MVRWKKLLNFTCFLNEVNRNADRNTTTSGSDTAIASLPPMSPEPTSDQVSETTDRCSKDGAPRHVHNCQNQGPVFDCCLVRQVVGGVGDQSKKGAQKQGLAKEPASTAGIITNTSSPATKSR